MSTSPQVLLSNVTLAAGSSSVLEVYLEDCKSFKCITEVSYPTTSSSTGITCTIYNGIPAAGGYSGVQTASPPFTGSIPSRWLPLSQVPSSTPGALPAYGDNSTNPVVLTTVVPSSGSSQIRRTVFYLNTISTNLAGLVKFVIVNVDPSVAATFSFYADIS